MVKLTVTAVAKAAIVQYCSGKRSDRAEFDDDEATRLNKLSDTEIGSPIEHYELILISKYLLNKYRNSDAEGGDTRRWRLDALLKGALVYEPPPPPKPEPSPEYKALMQRLRQQEEQRQYERMLNAQPPLETFSQRFPAAVTAPAFNPAYSYGSAGTSEEDEVTYADVNRQMILIINVLVSIVTCSIFVWIAARRWSVPQRLGLSMSSSGIVAVAEVAIYLGYIKRVKDAKQRELKRAEKKEIVETWIIEKSPTSVNSDSVRHRKGKHR
ncbi:hypothetical protein BAUCODRAFT_514440 [Baudoinia panamericana UAMH 10762]|uniref:Uncharacterized protein n=1 Tax=Baudoinia panamericana (strain UAMH 10762) TaxID=717646 RepID=M2MHH2_BAUPA|nr:uncharacterized protein BAUCODRAFT_514440 [Baudoinia panamericana UAMH 10762]EMC96046.1 hypothetical protein BAUCODRAFT_514440 [Baudoinia panamericana UAMH 10762]